MVMIEDTKTEDTSNKIHATEQGHQKVKSEYLASPVLCLNKDRYIK